jgi:hypothetical protein
MLVVKPLGKRSLENPEGMYIREANYGDEN